MSDFDEVWHSDASVPSGHRQQKFFLPILKSKMVAAATWKIKNHYISTIDGPIRTIASILQTSSF